MPIPLPNLERMPRAALIAWLRTVPEAALEGLVERMLRERGVWSLTLGDLADEERVRRIYAARP